MKKKIGIVLFFILSGSVVLAATNWSLIAIRLNNRPTINNLIDNSCIGLDNALLFTKNNEQLGTYFAINQEGNNEYCVQTITNNDSCTPHLSALNLSNDFGATSNGMSIYGLYSIKDPIEFIPDFVEEIATINWDFGDGFISNDIQPKHIFLVEGVFTITQKILYKSGKSVVFSKPLVIEKGFEVIIPTAFSPNNDGVNDTFRPVFKGLDWVKLEVYNNWGSLIYTEEGSVLKGWNGEIYNNLIEKGVYQYRVLATTFYGDEKEYFGSAMLIR